MRFHRRYITAIVAVACLLGCGSASPAGAASIMVILDPDHTEIRWVLHGFPDTVHGTFRLIDGALTLDPSSSAADGVIRVDARSGQSGNRSRDRKMHVEILESARYSVVSFRATRLESPYPLSGDGEVRIAGVLSLHGADHPMTLTVRLATHADSAVADTRMTIPYVAWGLTDPSVFIFRAAKTVDLEIHAVGTLGPNPRRLDANP